MVDGSIIVPQKTFLFFIPVGDLILCLAIALWVKLLLRHIGNGKYTLQQK